MSQGLFTQTHERGPVHDQVTGRAWLAAMLEAEAALAGACAAAGLLPAEAAEAIAAACADPGRYDEAALGVLAAGTGNPVVGLIGAIRAALPTEFARYVHYGATSQDVVDTAAMLVTHRAISALVTDLDGCSAAAASLAARHRDTPMIARTLLQQAVPITFGVKSAQWLYGIDHVRGGLGEILQRLPAQLGGAAGTLEAYPQHLVTRITADYSARLGLVPARSPWHTLRYPIGEVTGALATTAGILGKVALDLALLAQNEVGEVTSAADRRGGSSTMAHKRNPVAAVAARSAAKRAPGLAATLFAAMEQEHERAAGAWHAEWPTLTDLLSCVGSAAAWLRDALESVRVDEQRMAQNLAEAGVSASPGNPAAWVDRALADHRSSTDRPAIPTHDDEETT